MVLIYKHFIYHLAASTFQILKLQLANSWQLLLKTAELKGATSLSCNHPGTVWGFCCTAFQKDAICYILYEIVM